MRIGTEVNDFVEAWEDEFTKKMDAYEDEMRDRIQRFSHLMKRAAQTGLGPEDPELRAAQQAIADLRQKQEYIVQDAMQRIGITEEELQELEAQRTAARQQGKPDLIHRTHLIARNVMPTGTLEKMLPTALESLLRDIDPEWLRDQAGYTFRLDPSYWEQELSLVSGTRITSAQRPHRFAEHLLVAQDFLTKQPDYDFWAGALSIPTIAVLGSGLEALRAVRGDLRTRIESLHQGHSDLVDSTIYELLVAAASVRRGRSVELLEASKSEKTPDMRLHDMGVPFVIECKRRPALFAFEQQEETHARRMFQSAYAESTKAGISGVLEVRITCNLSDISPSAFAADVRRLLHYGMRNHNTPFDWGSLKFLEFPSSKTLQTTRLYSPKFLQAVFNWNVELPHFDGIICQVQSPGELFTESADLGLAMKWSSTSEDARAKKSRAVGALLGKALDQIPLGEMGAVFICFQEGGTPEIADERTKRIQEELHGWHHRWGIMLPAMCVNRIFPTPLGEGLPDLIENVLQGKAAEPDEIFQDLIPSLVFTVPEHLDPE